ncbi:origin recognition complex subunit 3 isoform X2 [Centruroides vittatus]|uniref:origin recognition complex subunit 3 isoform X2 n=1 Tax=Centruroides vittatus TaxID=120091 RepID=UPI00350F04F0
MPGDDTISLSKGCFVYRNQNTQTRAKEENWSKRREFYETMWARIESEIESIQETAHKSIIKDIVKFVKRGTTLRQLSEIPTCAIVLGVNTPDHSQFFNLLFRELESLTTHVIILNSRDCSNIASMVQKTVTGFIKDNEWDESSQLTKYNYTFSLLESWYMSKIQLKQLPKKCKSPRKKKKLEESMVNPPLVIVLDKFETFNSDIVENFILVCNSYVDKLPLVLIFGVATAMTTVHTSLTQKASSCLAIESFYSLSPVDYLSQVLQIIMNPSLPFKMGPNVFRLVVDYVLFYDFSVTNLKRLLKFCLFEHFYENKASILCCNENTVADNVRKLSKTELDDIIALHSIKSRLGGSRPNNRRTPIKQNIQKIIIDSLQNIHTNASEIDCLMPCLHGLVKDIPGQPFGKQIRELYQLILERDISTTEEFEKSFKLFGMMSTEDMARNLENFICILNEQYNGRKVESLVRIGTDIQDYLEKLKKLPENLPINVEEKTKSIMLNWGKMTSRSQLKEKLKDLVEHKKETPQEVWCNDLISYLKRVFGKLTSPSNLPLHEVFYFDDVAAVERHMLPSPRAALQNALRHPHNYLQCSCCKLKDLDEVPSSLPDICIAYKLHLECGRLINLYDWFQSFCMILQKKKQRKGKNGKKEDSVLFARFMNCVTELQLLGFIKPTQRKTDHMMRLTWGF